MSNGIAKLENGISVAWAAIHDGNKCCSLFGSAPVPDPLPEGYVYADTHEASFTAMQLKLYEVQTAYAAAIVAGYDTGLGFSLKLAEQDQRVLFDYQQRLLRQLAKQPPEIAPTDIKPLKGTDDAWHLATVEQIIAAIDGGAGYVESLNGAYAGYEAMLAAGVVEFNVDFTEL